MNLSYLNCLDVDFTDINLEEKNLEFSNICYLQAEYKNKQ